MGKKILMLAGEFSEEYEIFVYQQAMEAVGHTVHVICPDKKAGELIKTSPMGGRRVPLPGVVIPCRRFPLVRSESATSLSAGLFCTSVGRCRTKG